MAPRRSVMVVENMNQMGRALPGWHSDPAQVAQLRWWNGNEWTAYVRNTELPIPHDKSVGVAFALTFFFGPFGLFYISAWMAIAALAISLVVFVVTFGSGLTLTWLAIMILGCIMADRRHRDYQAWVQQRLRTSDGTSLPGTSPLRPAPEAHARPRHHPVWPTMPQRRPFAGGPARWHPDPTGRFELRWWNGDTWTPHVMNGDYCTMDPFWKR